MFSGTRLACRFQVDPMKVQVVYNPVAGGGREGALERLVVALQARQAEVEVYRTKAPGDATRWLRDEAGPADVVVAVGGDGTTNEVINGLPADTALAVMATGTANVLARELGVPAQPGKVAELVVSGARMRIWPGRLNGRRFLMWVGVGYDAWVVNATNLALKQKIGKGAYVLSMLSQIARYGSAHFTVTVDGTAYPCYSAIIANARYYGGSFILSRRADISRPQMQVLLFTRPGRWTLLRTVAALLVGRMESVAGVLSLPARHIEVAAVAGEPLQADGDPAGVLPASIVVDEAPVVVCVPAQTRAAFNQA